jgi:hypothetical protein
VSATIVAKSDQLNADDLVGGKEPVVQVTHVAKVTGEQPVVIAITGGHQPWKPCKTMRRVLVATWGADASQWVGRWMQLYRDDTVKWSNVPVGGIRIKAMSHIPKRVTLSLAETKGKKVMHTIEILKPPTQGPQSLEDHCAAFDACQSTEAFDVLEAARGAVWPSLSKPDKARLKAAADAAKARLSAPTDVPPMTPEEAARDLAMEHGD